MDEFAVKFVRQNVEHILLRYLSENAMHGYALITQIREDYGVYLGPSTLYPALNKRLEPEGLVKSCWDMASARPRKVYEITSKGLREFQRQKTILRQMLYVEGLFDTPMEKAVLTL